MDTLKVIARLIDDADFLVEHKRYHSALTLLLVAVAASSVKMFPKGTSSIDSPPKPGKKDRGMPDREKFLRFLGERIRKVILGDPWGPEDGRHASLMAFTEGPQPEEVLYELYRCPLIHEGGLPQDVRFSPETEQEDAGYGFRSLNRKLQFTHGVLRLLRAVVVDAPVNGIEFGKNFFRLVPNDSKSVHDLHNEIALSIQSSPGRVGILHVGLQEIGPSATSADDQKLRQLFLESPTGRRKPSGLRTEGPYSPICDNEGRLTENGIGVARLILRECTYVDAAR